MTPDVSVLIATYNVAPYIERAVQSALAQTGVSVEVVLVDDASSDATWSIVSAMADPRIKKYRLHKNGGPSGARNEALKHASGKWIAVLDGDDAFLEGRLARCLKLSQKEKADIVVDNIASFSEEGGTESLLFQPQWFNGIRVLSLARFIAGNSNFLSGTDSLGYLKPIFSSGFLKKNKLLYDPEIRIGEDYMLLAEALACNGRCVVEPRPGYCYTIRKGSISHRLTLDDVQRMNAGDEKFCANYKLNAEAERAQKNREKNLRVAADFISLVFAIKAHHWGDAVGAVTRTPMCIYYLWLPLWAAIKRLAKGLSR